jgi:hypothetical protein
MITIRKERQEEANLIGTLCRRGACLMSLVAFNGEQEDLKCLTSLRISSGR